MPLQPWLSFREQFPIVKQGAEAQEESNGLAELRRQKLESRAWRWLEFAEQDIQKGGNYTGK